MKMESGRTQVRFVRALHMEGKVVDRSGVAKIHGGRQNTSEAEIGIIVKDLSVTPNELLLVASVMAP